MSPLENVGSWLLAFTAGGLSVGGIVAWALVRTSRYLDSYLDQKGQQLATKEDFEELLKQQRATAREVEAIRAASSGELWLFQERWRLKRDIYGRLLDAPGHVRPGAPRQLR